MIVYLARDIPAFVMYCVNGTSRSSLLIESTDSMIYFNKMKKEVGMLLQKRSDTSAVGIYKLYEENTH